MPNLHTYLHPLLRFVPQFAQICIVFALSKFEANPFFRAVFGIKNRLFLSSIIQMRKYCRTQLTRTRTTLTLPLNSNYSTIIFIIITISFGFFLSFQSSFIYSDNSNSPRTRQKTKTTQRQFVFKLF